MATTRRTTKKADPTPEEKGSDIETVDVNDIPGLSEDDTEDNTEDNENSTENGEEKEEEENGEEEEEETRTPLEIELDNIPKVPNDEDDYIRTNARRLVPVILELRECNSVILRNTLSDAGIEEYAYTSENEEIVTIRKEMDELSDEIADLQRKLDKLSDDYEAEKKSLLDLARAEMKENINENEKEGAKSRKTKATAKFSRYSQNITAELDIDDTAHNPMREWIASHQKLVSGGIAQSSTSTNGNGRTDRDHSRRVREWAANNGIKCNAQGRIPDHVKTKYNQANPNDRIALYAETQL